MTYLSQVEYSVSAQAATCTARYRFSGTMYESPQSKAPRQADLGATGVQQTSNPMTTGGFEDASSPIGPAPAHPGNSVGGRSVRWKLEAQRRQVRFRKRPKGSKREYHV